MDVPVRGSASRSAVAAALMVLVALTTDREVRAASPNTGDPRGEQAMERPVAEALVVEPHACLTVPLVAAEVARVLGRDTLDRRASARIAPEGDGVRMTVAFDGAARGNRHIRAEPRCTDYVGVVAISLAMALDALGPRQEKENPSAPDADATGGQPPNTKADEPSVANPYIQTPPGTPPVEPPADAPSPPIAFHTPPLSPPRPLRPSLRMTVDTASNVLPGQTWALGTAVSFRRTTHGPRLRIGSSIVFPTDVAIDGSTVRASALIARGDGCVAPAPRFASFRLCAGLLIGAAFARGTTRDLARTTQLPLSHVSLGLELRLPLTGELGTLGGLAVIVGTEALAGLVRPEFVVSDANGDTLATKRPSLFGGLFRIGLEWDAR